MQMQHSSSLHQLQVLLDQIGLIDFQFKKNRQKNRFNIFNLLERKFDEVNLHSKLIYELINPKAEHCFGLIFLEKLLGQFGILGFELNNVKVRKEYKKIDILISNNKQAIVIENKLWAPDQPEQLQRYYDILFNEGYRDIKLFYLSIDGKEPDDNSTGNLILLESYKQVLFTVSYETDIDQWLEYCVKEAYNHPPLRETLLQYRSLVQEISGKTMNKEEMDEIIDFLAEGDNVLKAKKIAENWKNVKWFTEWYFWRDLETIINGEYEVLDYMKYDSNKLSSVVHNSRNRNPWYGIMFRIGEFSGADAHLLIERSFSDVYYGLTMIVNGKRNLNEDPKFSELAKRVLEFSDWGVEEYWIAGHYCEPKINFESFSNDSTLKLLNDDFRAKYLNDLWLLIKQFVIMVQQVLGDYNTQPNITPHSKS
ncbi:PD-(D/E)XK nuclease family protein [Mucilaginibacter terrae]|uniref:PD-(D/E)XK nuclease family protein n=1 Tax=Mucilaginibacter terrae TaxID=1955052 RepID=A0ABU3GVF5_9SPHI|nr:PD-(D/E)XK nuclease family protein [Mucilaginibacter terrae]MDT3403758.1 hypothetical protein [Mucilaginibacter terrae]